MTFRFSLRQYLTLAVFSVVGLFGVVQSFIHLFQAEQLVQSLIKDDARFLTKQVLHDFNSSALLHEHVIGLVAESISNQSNYSDEWLLKEFYAVLTQFPELHAIFVGKTDNTFFGLNRYENELIFMEVAPDDPAKHIRFYEYRPSFGKGVALNEKAGFDTASRPWFADAKGKDSPVWGGIFNYHINGLAALPVSIEAKLNDNQVLGVIGMNFFVAKLDEHFAMDSDNNASIFLLNKQGGVVFAAEKDKHLLNINGELLADFSAIQKNENSMVDIAGDSYLFYQSPVTKIVGNQYSILTLIPIQSRLQGVIESHLHYTGVIIVSFALVMICLVWFMRRMVQSLTPCFALLKLDPLTTPAKEFPEKPSSTFEVEEFTQVYERLRNSYVTIQESFASIHLAKEKQKSYLQEIQRLVRVSEFTHDLVVIVKPDTRVIWFNKSFADFFDESAEMRGSQNLFLSDYLLKPAIEQISLKKIQSAIELGENVDQEISLNDDLGDEYHFKVEVKSFYGSSDDERESFCVFSDITQIRQQQESLKLWQEIFEKAKWGILISQDENVTIVHVNPHLADMLGYDREFLTGRHLQEFAAVDLKARIPEISKKIKKEGEAVYQGQLIHKAGHEVPVFVNVTQVYRNDGLPGYRVAIIQDISAHLELQNMLRQQSKMKMLGELTTGIVHDFNNILGAISFKSSILTLEMEKQSDALDRTTIDKLQKYTRGIEKSVQAASDLINQILIFSKKQTLLPQSVNLSTVIIEALDVFSNSSDDAIELEKNIRSPDLLVSGVKSQLFQLTLNLVSNARKAVLRRSIERRKIKISLSTQNDTSKPYQGYAVLSVEDNGDGIAPELKDKIFEPFNTFDDGKQSTGIGLALVKKVVDLHNGAIEIESELCNGTCFRVYLPCAPGEKVEHNDVSEESTGKRFKMVIVDDEAPLVESLQQLLSAYGHSITAFTDSLQACDYIISNINDIDIIVSDFLMPNLNGRGLLERVRAVSKNVPVVITTGYVDVIDNRNLISAGANEVLIKPVTAMALIKHAERLCR